MSSGTHGTTDTAFSRRTAITGTLAAASLLAATRSTAAQEATPVTDEVSYLFVQACESGSATPSSDSEGSYHLTLQHASGQTLFFADHPERLAGIIPTADFIDDLAAAADDPPNAALAFSPDDSTDAIEVAVVELTASSADPVAGTITYQAHIIETEPQQDGATAGDETIAPVSKLPASFGQATLFIDALSGAANQAIIVANLSGPDQRVGIWKKPPRD